MDGERHDGLARDAFSPRPDVASRPEAVPFAMPRQDQNRHAGVAAQSGDVPSAVEDAAPPNGTVRPTSGKVNIRSDGSTTMSSGAVVAGADVQLGGATFVGTIAALIAAGTGGIAAIIRAWAEVLHARADMIRARREGPTSAASPADPPRESAQPDAPGESE